MKKLNSRIFSAFLALLLVFSLLSGITFTADAATVNYQYGSNDDYSNVIKNWGTRGETATFLSPNAKEFYSEVSYKELSALSGSSDITVVNTTALYAALNQLMAEAHSVKNNYGEVRYLCQFTDIEENGSKEAKISSFYSGVLVGPDWDWSTARTWSREHVWPDSKGGSSDTENSTKTNEADIMMIRPVPMSENSSRSNKAYGVSSGYYYPNLGDYDVRGDVARIVLYTYVRWGTEQQAVLDNMWGTSGVIESKDVLLDWMEADPVDTWEMGRNDSVQSITGTRNVFVDYPELAFELFEADIPEDYDTPSGNAAAVCLHINTTTVRVPATCAVNGSETVTCDDCGEVVSKKVLTEDHQYRCEVIEPTLSAGGYTIETCTVCGDETIEEPVPPLTTIESWNLTLADDVSVNFKIDVDEAIRSTAKIHIAVANDAKTYPVSGLTVNADGYYYVSVKVAACQMTEVITVQITNGNDATEKKTYTVRDYALTILEGNYPETAKNLVTRMLHYGAAAQSYFNYKVDALANADVAASVQYAPKTSNVYSLQGALDGISFYGATMMFRDRIALRYYFTVTGDISNYTFTANGNACTPVKKGDYYYIEVADINPQDLDNRITVKVNNTLTVTYSPMNYVVNMHTSGSEEMQALVQTLYDYHLAAVAYLEANA